MNWCRRLGLSFLFWWGAAALPGAEPEWLSGPELAQAMREPISLTWAATPAREALTRLGHSQRIALWLDRRIDPGKPLVLSAQALPWQGVVRQAADQLSARGAFAGPLVYVGPARTADTVWTVAALRAAEAAQLPGPQRARWLTKRPRKWAELAEPRALLEACAQEAGAELLHAERIPHDLWAAGSWPPLTLVEYVTLLLAGFGQTYRLTNDGARWEPVPWPDSPQLVREFAYRETSGPGEPPRWTAWQREFPEMQLQLQGNKLSATGTAEALAVLEQRLRNPTATAPSPTPTPPPSLGKLRYTIQIQNAAAGAVLRELEKKAGLEVEMAAEAKPKLAALVSFSLRDATLEQVLDAALHPAGLQYELQGTKLRVRLPNP